MIMGEPKGATEFSVEVGPGENASKILKPEQQGVGTSLEISLTFELEEK